MSEKHLFDQLMFSTYYPSGFTLCGALHFYQLRRLPCAGLG